MEGSIHITGKRCSGASSLAVKVFTFLLLLLILVSTGPGSLSAAGPGYRTDLEIRGPTRGSGGSELAFRFTFMATGPGVKLGSALVRLPPESRAALSGYRVNRDSVKASGGKRWSASLIERGGSRFLLLTAAGQAHYLDQDQQVSVIFAASLPEDAPGGSSHLFATRAWSDCSSRDSSRVDPSTGQAENLVSPAPGQRDPELVLDRPREISPGSFSYKSSGIRNLEGEFTGRGSGFKTTVAATLDSLAFLTVVDAPAVHLYTTEYYSPAEEGRWNMQDIVSGRQVELIQGYMAGWRTYYHLAENPMKNQMFPSLRAMLQSHPDLQGLDLTSFSETQLRELAYHQDISFFRTRLQAQTEQVWFARVGVGAGTGEKAYLKKRIDAHYGTAAFAFREDGSLWDERRGYRGPDHGFGFVASGDGYRIEKGRNYPGSSIDVYQEGYSSKGDMIRQIDISSAYSGAFYSDGLDASGRIRVDEEFFKTGMEPGQFLPWPAARRGGDDFLPWPGERGVPENFLPFFSGGERGLPGSSSRTDGQQEAEGGQAGSGSLSGGDPAAGINAGGGAGSGAAVSGDGQEEETIILSDADRIPPGDYLLASAPDYSPFFTAETSTLLEQGGSPAQGDAPGRSRVEPGRNSLRATAFGLTLSGLLFTAWLAGIYLRGRMGEDFIYRQLKKRGISLFR